MGPSALETAETPHLEKTLVAVLRHSGLCWGHRHPPPAALLTSCATLSTFLSFSMSSFSHLKGGVIVIPSQMDVGRVSGGIVPVQPKAQRRCGAKHTPKKCRLLHMLILGRKEGHLECRGLPIILRCVSWDTGHLWPSPRLPIFGLVSTSPLHCPRTWVANSICHSA